VAAFATPAELASHLQVPTVDNATANLALDFATGRIRDECGWSITQETGVTKTLDSYGRPSLWLRTRLLTAVTSVVENGVTLADNTHYRWWENGQLERRMTCWPTGPRTVVAVFTHGYVTAPISVKGVCLDLAGRLYDNPAALKAYTAGGVSETFGADQVPLTLAELSDLDGYRLYPAA